MAIVMLLDRNNEPAIKESRVLDTLVKLSNTKNRLGRQKEGMLEVAATMAYQNASDPRNKVFSILSLVKGEEEAAIVPDYTQTVAESYSSTTLALFKAQRSLECLAYVSLFQPRPHALPSWAVDFSLTGINVLGPQSFFSDSGLARLYSPGAHSDEELLDYDELDRLFTRTRHRLGNTETMPPANPFVNISSDCMRLTIRGISLDTVEDMFLFGLGQVEIDIEKLITLLEKLPSHTFSSWNAKKPRRFVDTEGTTLLAAALKTIPNWRRRIVGVQRSARMDGDEISFGLHNRQYVFDVLNETFRCWRVHFGLAVSAARSEVGWAANVLQFWRK